MIQDEYEDIKRFCIELFGQKSLEIEEFNEPRSVEIYIRFPRKDSQIKTIEVALYDSQVKMAFMHINSDFTFEYKPRQKDSIEAIKRYLVAAASYRLKIRARRVLGFKIGNMLVIE